MAIMSPPGDRGITTSWPACSAADTISPRPPQVMTWKATQSCLVTLTFWPWNWCETSAVARTTFLPILVFLCDFAFSRQTCIRFMTWPYYLDLWPLTSPRMLLMRVTIYSMPVPSLNLCTGSRVSRVMGFFLPIFSFLCPSRLRVRHVTKRRTGGQIDDGHQHFVPHRMGRQHNGSPK